MAPVDNNDPEGQRLLGVQAAASQLAGPMAETYRLITGSGPPAMAPSFHAIKTLS
jgi:hypothetical protein